MKKLLISILGIVVVLAFLYGLMKPANAPTADKATPTPSGSTLARPSPTPTPTPEANLTVTLPKPGQQVSSPITVSGMGRVFEQQFNWRLVDMQGTKITEGTARTNAPDAGQFGPYTFTINTTAKGNLIILVFDISEKDGSVTDLVQVPVIVK